MRDIKLAILRFSIEEAYRQATIHLKTGIDDDLLLESATRDLKEVISLHKSDKRFQMKQANLKFTEEWTCVLLELLRDTPVDKIDELSSDQQSVFNCLLIDEPAKELAQVLADRLSLKVAGPAVVIASSLPRLAALGSPETTDFNMTYDTGKT